MASSSFLRWPSDVTPISFRSSVLRRSNSARSMSLARNNSAYWASPIRPSHMSMVARTS